MINHRVANLDAMIERLTRDAIAVEKTEITIMVVLPR